MASPTLVRLDRRPNGVAVLTLDHPPLNLVTRALTEQMLAVQAALADDGDLRAVVVTGAGARAFCAGADVKEFDAVRDQVVARKLRDENEMMHGFEELAVPVVAAIDGAALGAGCELALACDLRVMAEDARIGQPEVRLGAIPGSGGLFRLPRLVGTGPALEMLFFGDAVGAAEAHRLGLVNQVVPSGEALPRALEWADRLAEGPHEAFRAIKQGVYGTLGLPSRQAAEVVHPMSQQVFDSAGLAEGAAAFLEKRPARFR